MSQILSTKTRKALQFLAYVRLVTIDQFAFAAQLSRSHASDFLRTHARKKYLGKTGDIPLSGSGRAPAVYFMTRKGWEFYSQEELIELGDFVNAKPQRTWSQGMHHRLRTVTIAQHLGRGIVQSGEGRITAQRFDFKKEKHMGKVLPETQDYVSHQVNNNTRLVPDAAFNVTRNNGKSGLMFLETDMGTEPIPQSNPRDSSIETKLHKYEAYFSSERYQKRYADWATHNTFRVLLVTTTAQRITSMRNKLSHMKPEFHELIRFTTHDDLLENPMGSIWFNRDARSTVRSNLWS